MHPPQEKSFCTPHCTLAHCILNPRYLLATSANDLDIRPLTPNPHTPLLNTHSTQNPSLHKQPPTQRQYTQLSPTTRQNSQQHQRRQRPQHLPPRVPSQQRIHPVGLGQAPDHTHREARLHLRHERRSYDANALDDVVAQREDRGRDGEGDQADEDERVDDEGDEDSVGVSWVRRKRGRGGVFGMRLRVLGGGGRWSCAREGRSAQE